ncbi:MAG: O-antigen ligase family protein [Flavobacteriaceae bacterium]|nr:O-antigen ligase family protein [Flavobacteriaceae bacterium]MDG1790984.1 O-antigen ligase family protein [Flavobacteriaceae bacterium]MDG2447174.1 O-antigen ligase family protein [Flavobacteriaceae bacterium]
MRILLAAIYPYVFILLYLVIPFDEYVRVLPNILMLILIVIFPIIINKKDLKKIAKVSMFLLILFIIYLLTNSFVQGRLEVDFVYLKTIMIPLGIVFLYVPITDFKKVNKAIIFSSFIAIVYSLIKFLILVNQNTDVSINFFQETVDALLIDRIYVGLLCVLSVIISYQSITKQFHPDNKYYLISMVLNVTYLLLIMSKTAIIILLFVAVLRQFYGKDKKIRLGATAIILAFLAIMSYFKLPNNIENTFKPQKDISEVTYAGSTIPLSYRSLIWDCALKITKDSNTNFFGIGFRETSDRLVNCYENEIEDLNTKQNFINKRFNTHNQYFDFYISSGLISIILFVGILIYLFFKKHKDYYSTSLLLSIILFGLAENYFHRQVGAYYIGFVLVILLINNKNLAKNIEC